MLPLRIVLYRPDHPHNFGSVLRTCACLGAELHVIEPCGFPLDDRRIRQSALDYGTTIGYTRHVSWAAFLEQQQEGRLVLLSTKGDTSLYETEFHPGDWLLFGQESAGVPEPVHEAAELRVTIPMQPGMRSLNVAISAAITLSEARRQLCKP